MSAPASPHRSITHLPALDGLRGLAVLGVVLFHSGGMLKGGYLGVDLFFVLSGFLITSILLAEHRRSGRIALGAFWVRRARRLFPALLALMPAIAVYARVFAQPDELAGLRGDALATLGYVANWRAVFSNKSYWELFAAPSPLEHTWSLAIEEQFYVVWPLLVFGVLVVLRWSSRALLVMTAILTALSVAAMLLFYSPDSTTRAYFGTDTRAAAILVGAALAMIMGPDPKLGDRARRWLDPLGVVALVGLGVAWARLDGQDPFLYRAGFWLSELACLVLIACAVAPGSLVARALSVRPLTYAGSISYGIYLWHWPIDCVLVPERVHVGPLPLLALRLGATLAISMVSYRWLEQPIRTRGLPFGKPLVVVPASFALAALVVVVGTR
ncbi:MAG TPA: acyltransferase, partial [Polyangiaceae bacterium]